MFKQSRHSSQSCTLSQPDLSPASLFAASRFSLLTLTFGFRLRLHKVSEGWGHVLNATYIACLTKYSPSQLTSESCHRVASGASSCPPPPCPKNPSPGPPGPVHRVRLFSDTPRHRAHTPCLTLRVGSHSDSPPHERARACASVRKSDAGHVHRRAREVRAVENICESRWLTTYT